MFANFESRELLQSSEYEINLNNSVGGKISGTTNKNVRPLSTKTEKFCCE